VAKAIRRALSWQGITEVFKKSFLRLIYIGKSLLEKTSAIPYRKYTPLVALASGYLGQSNIKRNNTVLVPSPKVSKAIRRVLLRQGITEMFSKKLFKAHLHWQKLLRKKHLQFLIVNTPH
jgi:hypothetical protein